MNLPALLLLLFQAATPTPHPPPQLAPPGWEMCTMPSFYNRPAEPDKTVFVERWVCITRCQGGPNECGQQSTPAHDMGCYSLTDGGIYAMLGQYGSPRYARPDVASASQFVTDQYHQCFDLHVPVFGPGPAYPCTAGPLPGTQHIGFVLWADLPEGSSKVAYGNKYGCSTAVTLTPTPPGATRTPTPPPVCPTCAAAATCPPTATRTPTRTVTRTPCAACTPTNTPQIGPRLTPTPTPHVGP